MASVVGQAQCCSVVIVDNENSVQLPTFGNSKNHPVPPDTFDTFIWEALVHHFNDNDATKRRLEITRVQ